MYEIWFHPTKNPYPGDKPCKVVCPDIKAAQMIWDILVKYTWMISARP